MRTLAAQGGPMSAAEVTGFAAHLDAQLAVALWLIDDRGKEVGLAVPGLDSHRPWLEEVVATRRRGERAGRGTRGAPAGAPGRAGEGAGARW